jgi:hypothetical protein
MLIQLPCGSWVDPSDIRVITISASKEGKKIVVTITKGPYISSHLSNPIDDAEKVRDALADQVNKAKLANLMPTTGAPPSKS